MTPSPAFSPTRAVLELVLGERRHSPAAAEAPLAPLAFARLCLRLCPAQGTPDSPAQGFPLVEKTWSLRGSNLWESDPHHTAVSPIPQWVCGMLLSSSAGPCRLPAPAWAQTPLCSSWEQLELRGQLCFPVQTSFQTGGCGGDHGMRLPAA